MPELGHHLQAQLEQLRQLHKQGLLSEANYRAALAGLGVDPAAVFDQQQQQVERQINVAGDYVDQRQMAPAPGASPEALRRAYLHRLAQQTRRLPLTGVDPKAASDEGSGELQLSAVYTALLTQHSEEPEEHQIGKMAWRWEESRRRLSALEVLNRQPRLVLLGEPGGGKSTFVNFVALCLAGEVLGYADANLALLTAPLPVEEDRREKKEPQPQPWEHGQLLPVRVVLRDLAARGLPDAGKPVGGDVLWRFILAELGEMLQEYAPHLKQELMEHGGLILLDGLDEVPDAGRRREQVKRVVQDFADCFPRCRFLVTSRTYAYQRQDWKLEGFAEAVLSPFTPGQITRFVDGWYAHIGALRDMDPQDAQGRATLLKTAIQRSGRLAELATRPLLLTLMASLHAWRGGSLPEKREELYADAVDLLLDQWESPKVVRDAAGQPLVRQPSLAEWLKVDRAVVRAELNRLAFEAHRDQPQLVGTADVRQERLVSALMGVSDNPEVNPTRLVEYIRDRAGLLAARGEGVYTFPHRTFQEYLAACYLTDYGYPDELADLVRADPQRWREATLLAGAKAARGTASAAWNLAEALCFHDPPPVGQDVILSDAEADCWGALLAAQTLLENEGARLGQVPERNAPKLERVRRWLLAIVTRGWLPPADRALAGNALAVLGDERNFGELVTVPAGPFLMGDDEDERARPQHEVRLAAFKIGVYPVTNAQYLRFVEATGRAWRSDEGRRPERANHPAISVSWHDARAYCAWLTEVWRTEGKVAADEVVRLPSEAEWEKAARGGLPSPSEGEGLGERVKTRIYPWGDDWDETKCNTSELGLGDTTPVGIFPEGASPYGCLDMAGNVWEWTISLWGKDWLKPEFKYPYDSTDGRENLEAGNDVLRVLRGGSWSGSRSDARCAFRYWDYPGYHWLGSGFRLVVSPISPDSAL
jgi:formylglycine-generating enzyme required for sulfatase activity